MDTADEHTRCGPRRKVVMWRYFPGEVGNLEADVVVTAKYLAARASLRQDAWLRQQAEPAQLDGG